MFHEVFPGRAGEVRGGVLCAIPPWLVACYWRWGRLEDKTDRVADRHWCLGHQKIGVIQHLLCAVLDVDDKHPGHTRFVSQECSGSRVDGGHRGAICGSPDIKYKDMGG